ncbi:DUF4145 domain-containing protein [Actinoplanes sp. NPDC004185]
MGTLPLEPALETFSLSDGAEAHPIAMRSPTTAAQSVIHERFMACDSTANYMRAESSQSFVSRRLLPVSSIAVQRRCTAAQLTASVSRNDHGPLTCSGIAPELRQQSTEVHGRPRQNITVVTQLDTHAPGVQNEHVDDSGTSSNKIKTVMICPHCDLPALQEINGTVTVPPDDHASSLFPGREYTLLQCGECNEASLQIREVYEFFDEAGPGVPQFAYPAERRLSTQVPEDLKREFEEAQTCLNAKAYTATVVMVRRTLEGICKDNGIGERVLARGLKKMEEQGLIDRTLAEWADGLRVLGNQGAHYTGTQVSRQDAVDALAFAEALVDQIYVMRRRFEEFKKRRELGNAKVDG